MNNYKLIIQYDGGRYKGWQRLGNEDNTIQGKLEKVLSTMVGTETELIGCSRTDARVHAIAQVANFKAEIIMSAKEVKNYLNQYLPQDISVIEVKMVPEKYHARYHALHKTYLYKVWNMEHPNPFLRKYSWHIPTSLNIEGMKTASQYFLGQHDFTTFSNAKSKKKSMVRVIRDITIKKEEGLIMIRVTGDGFLYNMVRKIVGVLVQVGLGEIKSDEIPLMIQSKERSQLGILAEASGLYLEKVVYDEEE